MPKLIEDAPKRILETAKEQLFTVGYKKLTMRKTAVLCGIATGTIYNYFPNKEMLVASIMAKDWSKVLSCMRRACQAAQDMEAGVRAIYDGLCAFSQEYERVWAEYGFGGGLPAGFGARHLMLRQQLAQLLLPLLERFGKEEDAMIAPLFCETILAAAMQKDIDYPALKQLVEKTFA